MLRFLADENFNADVVRGLLLRLPALDVVRAQDVGLLGLDDPKILAWAASNERIVLTHDRNTMAGYADELASQDRAMAGVFVVHDRIGVGQAIDELLLIASCSEQDEWKQRIVFVPL